MKKEKIYLVYVVSSHEYNKHEIYVFDNLEKAEKKVCALKSVSMGVVACKSNIVSVKTYTEGELAIRWVISSPITGAIECYLEETEFDVSETNTLFVSFYANSNVPDEPTYSLYPSFAQALESSMNDFNTALGYGHDKVKIEKDINENKKTFEGSYQVRGNMIGVIFEEIYSVFEIKVERTEKKKEKEKDTLMVYIVVGM